MAGVYFFLEFLNRLWSSSSRCGGLLEEFQACRLPLPPHLGGLALLQQPFALLFSVPGLRGQLHLTHSVPALNPLLAANAAKVLHLRQEVRITLFEQFLTTYELYGLLVSGGQLLIGGGQLLLIAWGIWEMRKSNDSREASTGLMIEQSKGLAQQSKALERLLERSA